MNKQTVAKQKKIALVAHDNKKDDLIDWAKGHKDILAQHQLCATGTTGGLLEKELGLSIEKLKSGPLGGDLQIGGRIAESAIDLLIFFWDPLEAQPHDPDVKALLRVAVVWNIPVACNRVTANYIFASSMLDHEYQHFVPDEK